MSPVGGRGQRQSVKLLAVSVLLAGCGAIGGSAAPLGYSSAGAGTTWSDACLLGDGRAVAEGDLGVALAFSAPELPADLEALAALIAARAPSVSASVEGVATGPWSATWLGIPGCTGLPLSRLLPDAQGPRLSFVTLGAVAREKRALASQHVAARRYPEARGALSAAAAHEPVPLPDAPLEIGASYLAEERFGQAAALFEQLSATYPLSADGWAGLATSRRRLDRRLEAVDAASRAVALHPRALLTMDWLRGDPFVEWRAPLLPPAVWVAGEGGGWRYRLSRAGAPPDNPHEQAEAAAYASCKESFRRSPELRRAITGRPLPSWRWTPAEESVCTLMWLRSYQQHLGQGRAAVEGLDAVALMARDRLLDERALHDLLLPVDERAVFLLSEARRKRLYELVARHRLIARRDAGWLFP